MTTYALLWSDSINRKGEAGYFGTNRGPKAALAEAEARHPNHAYYFAVPTRHLHMRKGAIK